MQLSKQAYQLAASKLRCEIPAIMAIDSVESGGKGIIDGRPVILFEPHIFWKRLRAHGLDPEQVLLQHPDLADILYLKWGSKPYPSGQDAQHLRLERATKIHREAALESCSWGRYQIMGYNWKDCGCSSLQAFINEIFKDEESHLNLFTAYILTNHLDDELRARNWAAFAEQYNGPLYKRNNYDTKLSLAYNRFTPSQN